MGGFASDVSVLRSPGELTVNAKLREGGELGLTLTREQGHLVVKVDGLYAAAQGSGAGTRAMESVVGVARALGASEVRLNAGQVGRYAWAKAGFQWTPATGASMERAYRSWLDSRGHDVRIADGTGKSPAAMAGSRYGKEFLTSDAPNWNGSRRL